MELTAEMVMDWLPIVAHHSWRIKDSDNRENLEKASPIRNGFNACPICAMVDEIVGITPHQKDFKSAVSALKMEYDDSLISLVRAVDLEFSSLTCKEAELRKQLITLLLTKPSHVK